MRPPRLLRNASSRLLAAHLAVILVTGFGLFAWIDWAAGGAIDDALKDRVALEVADLVARYDGGGADALAAEIEARQADPEQSQFVYLLRDAAGRRLAGNLAAWPAALAPGSGWAELELPRSGEASQRVAATARRMAGGETLLVGETTVERAMFNRTLAQAVAFGLVLAAALAVFTGWLLSRLLLRRMDEIGRAASAIVGGDLASRIATDGGGGEFDRLADALNQMLARIETLVGGLRLVTDSLGHDLRGPLGRLERHLEAALTEDDVPLTRDHVEAALRESRAVLATASGLLDLSRIEAGVAAEQFERLDLARLAMDVAELYDAAAEEKGLRLTTDLPPCRMVDGHPQLLAQMLSNLLENALRFAPEGSEIRLSLGADGRAALAVADRGPGVPEADRARVVRPFVRLDASRGTPGAGLGLAIVDAIARLHRARLTLADNAPGLRAEVTFPPCAPEDEPDVIQASDGRGRRRTR